jgi:hypothetical protein
MAVIDGPSLAYHAYAIAKAKLFLVQGNASSARHGPAPIPSYAATGAAFIAWLDALQSFGFSVGALYFDSALPAIKRPIRLQRVNSRAKDLQMCRSAYPTDAELVPMRTGASRKLLSNDECSDNSANLVQDLAADTQFRQRGGATAAGKMKSGIFSTLHSTVEPLFSLDDLFGRVYPRSPAEFPPPPFLVTSVVEALRQHEEYGRKTCLVPGEADPYCAGFARLHHATVFTADSDALAYDLGPSGAVMMLGNISLGGLDVDGSRQLHGKVYQLGKIARRFGLRSLTPLAYAVYRDRFKSLNQNLEIARQIEKNPSQEYQQFKNEYVPQEFLNRNITRLVDQVLQQVDTPLSEWVYNGFDALRNDNDSASLDMWLPTVLEDASRAAPWIHGANLRRLAYSIIRPRQKRISYTSEHMRKGHGNMEVVVRHVENAQILAEITTFQDLIISSINLLSYDARPLWRELGLLWLCRSCVESGRDVPTRRNLELVFGGNVYHSWDLLHLFAQLQAILYSWRILMQSLKIYLAFDITDDPYIESAKTLRNTLESIDGALLTIMFDPLHEEAINQGRLDFVIGRIFEQLGIHENNHPQDKQPNTRKKKKRKKDTSSQKVIRPSDSKNRFSVLGSMNE